MHCSSTHLAPFRIQSPLGSVLRRQQRCTPPQRVTHVSRFWHGSTPPVPLAKRYLSKMAQRFQKARRSPNGETSVSKVYADANVKQPKDYWEYETLTVSWGCARVYSSVYSCSPMPCDVGALHPAHFQLLCLVAQA